MLNSKILVPVDGSADALQAVRHAVAEHGRHGDLEVHLLNVQPRLTHHIARFVGRGDREAWLAGRAAAATQGAAALLAEAGVPHRTHQATGDAAVRICEAARLLGVDRIVLGTTRKNLLTRLIEGSVTERVMDSAPVPVEIVAGREASKWERWGLPAGVFGGGGLLLLAAVE